MTETRDELELSRSRLAFAADYQTRRANGLYEKLRRLENKVRDTIVVGESFNSDGLYELRQMVPSKPRPTLTQLRKRPQRKRS